MSNTFLGHEAASKSTHPREFKDQVALMYASNGCSDRVVAGWRSVHCRGRDSNLECAAGSAAGQAIAPDLRYLVNIVLCSRGPSSTG